jgi:hypothetical protein
MLEFAPYQRLLARIFAGSKNYQEVSYKSSILYPNETKLSSPAIYLEGQLDKITGFIEGVTLEIERKRLSASMKEHKATIAYHIHDALVLDGYVYKGSMKHALVATSESFFKRKVTEYTSKAVLACTFCGNSFFSHWMIDDLTLTLAAQELGEAIATPREPYTHEPDYLNLFGIQTRQVTQLKCGELLVIDDVGQNSFKRQRYESLRSSLKKLTPLEANSGIMIRRGKSGVSRIMTNEDEVAQFLQTRGFSIVDPQNMSAQEIVRKMLGAKIIVGTEGSHMAHGLFTMADCGTIINLQPPYRFHGLFKDFTDCLDMRYAFVVGNDAPGGFTIDLEELARTLDKVEYLMK